MALHARRPVGVHVHGNDVVNYLLKDPHFPRTVLHCLAPDQVQSDLGEVPDAVSRQYFHRHQQEVGAGGTAQ